LLGFDSKGFFFIKKYFKCLATFLRDLKEKKK